MAHDQQRRRTVLHFALYGAETGQSWVDMVHYEPIPLRAGRFDFEIKPHVHDALIQVLYVTRGGGETFIDHILLGGAARDWLVADSLRVLTYRETGGEWKQRLSDHCPVSVRLRLPD